MSIDTKRQCSARIFRFDEVCRTSSCATPMHTVCAPSTHFHNFTSRNPNFQLCACASHEMSPYIILNYTTNNLLLINSSFHFPHPLRCASRRNLFKCSLLVVEFCVFGKGSTDLFDKRCALPKWRKQKKKTNTKCFGKRVATMRFHFAYTMIKWINFLRSFFFIPISWFMRRATVLWQNSLKTIKLNLTIRQRCHRKNRLNHPRNSLATESKRTSPFMRASDSYFWSLFSNSKEID